MMKKPRAGSKYLVIGLMSGTSVDAVDAALVRLIFRRSRVKIQLLKFVTLPYAQRLRATIFQAFDDKQSSASLICQLNFSLGEAFAKAATKLMDAAGLTSQQILAIGSHGQTIYHIPPHLVTKKRLRPSTLQIGEASIIAINTGITTVSDFRPADMAVGGNGAPLITFADYHLLMHAKKTRIVQNIGGIANCTLLPANCSIEQVIGFDSGPGNMVIDALAQHVSDGKYKFDKDGQLAGKGKIDSKLLKHLLRHPYFRVCPPKTTGRETFGLQYTHHIINLAKKRRVSLLNLLATATALTAETIVNAYEAFIFPYYEVDQVIVGGGGANNKILMNMLRQRLPSKTKLLRHEDLGIDSKAKEAIGFALLAYACLQGIPANIPSVTGAQQPVILGKIYHPYQKRERCQGL